MCADADSQLGHRLIDLLLTDNGDRTAAASSLLAECQKGFPVSNLEVLFRSSDQDAVGRGIWIASELGREAKPLLSNVVPLLGHPASQVRFFALDCISSCVGASDIREIGTALDLLDDPDEGVRWKALSFLVTIPAAALGALIGYRSHETNPVSHIQGLELTQKAVSGDDASFLSAYLVSEDLIVRGYAAAASVRVADRDMSPLRNAMQSGDATIRQFAHDMFERLMADKE